MAITPHQLWIAKCDRCGDRLELDYGIFQVFEELGQAEQDAINAGWQKIDGELVCASCIEDAQEEG